MATAIPGSKLIMSRRTRRTLREPSGSYRATRDSVSSHQRWAEQSPRVPRSYAWEMGCGRKDRKLFKQAIRQLCRVMKQTGDLTLLTDGERRYGNILFEICHQVLRKGTRGRPKKTL